MTREGAIGNLIHAIRWNDMPKKEALDMAIQALKQEPICPSHGVDCEDCPAYKPQEPCDDAISRQAAIIALDDRMSSLDNVDMQIAMGFAKGIIYDLPPVTPQPKTGHWILDADREHGRCSECGCKEDLVDGHSSYKWCSNCGAKMVEPQERSE